MARAVDDGHDAARERGAAAFDLHVAAREAAALLQVAQGAAQRGGLHARRQFVHHGAGVFGLAEVVARFGEVRRLAGQGFNRKFRAGVERGDQAVRPVGAGVGRRRHADQHAAHPPPVLPVGLANDVAALIRIVGDGVDGIDHPERLGDMVDLVAQVDRIHGMADQQAIPVGHVEAVVAGQDVLRRGGARRRPFQAEQVDAVAGARGFRARGRRNDEIVR